MELKRLSTKYQVRRLTQNDTDSIYQLCSSNPAFYQYHPPFVSKESILQDMNALPPNKGYEDKFYIGFFAGDELIAIMDLIQNYPRMQTAFIGLFMVDGKVQGKGIGSSIIEECLTYLKTAGFKICRLAIDDGNPQSLAFWTKNKFILTGEVKPNEFSATLTMERKL